MITDQKFYEIDAQKIQTLDDVKKILSAIPISITGQDAKNLGIDHLLKE